MNGEEEKFFDERFIRLEQKVNDFFNNTYSYRKEFLDKKLDLIDKKLNNLPCAIHAEKIRYINDQIKAHWAIFVIIVASLITIIVRLIT